MGMDTDAKMSLLGDTGDADGSSAGGCAITKLPGVFNARLQYAGRFIRHMRREQPDRRITPAGVTTQFVVGAAGERDTQVLRLVSSLLSHGLLHHAHYSAFQPVTETPLTRARPDGRSPSIGARSRVFALPVDISPGAFR